MITLTTCHAMAADSPTLLKEESVFPIDAQIWHASCALSGRRILIHGGYDGDNALGDTFIFDLAVCLPYNYENQEEDEVMIFGGGDNDGAFYQDLLSLCIPFHPVVQAD
nr:hypothetical protein BaRGS_032935 [Batillaria attramentaria]